MAERELPRIRSAASRLDFVVERLEDRDAIRALLRPRAEYAAYAIGQLEPAHFGLAEWFRAAGKTGTAIVVHSQGGLGDATFVMGDPDAARAIVAIHPGPGQTYLTCQVQHLEGLREVYRLGSHQPMMRMAVTRDTFVPAETTAVRLTGVDVRRINALYSSDGGASFYTPDHIDTGVYRGVVADGRLVSIAGTHVVSRFEGVAVVGNVYTHPRYRGRGYATITTSAVTEVLLEYCDTVVLTVDPLNTPAVHAYQRLGYYEVSRLIEATGVRRDPLGWATAFRRWRAGARGRRYGGELISIRSTVNRS